MFDYPAGGIGFAEEGLAFVVLQGQGFLEVRNGEGTFVVVLGVEAFREACDPVGFGLEIGAELPEGGQLGRIDGRGSDGKATDMGVWVCGGSVG
jgi:hypothetical protein